MKRLIALGTMLSLATTWLVLGAGLIPASARAQSAAQAPQTPLINLFYIGNRHSAIEPCGCHSKQQGGVQFEATIYDEHAAAPSVRIDAGEWTYQRITDMPLESLKTRYLLRAMKQMGLDVVNIGTSELQLSAEFFKNYAEKYPDAIPNYVSANVFRRDKPEEHAFPTSRILKRPLPGGGEVTIGITGVADIHPSAEGLIDPSAQRLETPDQRSQNGKTQTDTRATTQPEQLETGDFIAREPGACLAPVLAELRPKVDILIVLYTGSFPASIRLTEQFQQIDFLISTGQAIQAQVPSFQKGNVCILNVKNFTGREVGLAPLTLNQGKRWMVQGQPQMLAVGHDLKPKQPLLDLIAAFKKETQSLDTVLPSPDAPRIYTGSSTCIACHGAIYKDWQDTRHARALRTLTDKEQQFNPECLKCHTTGFRQANGFYSVTQAISQPMFNVGCEDCHGPAKEHADTQQYFKSGAEKWMEPAKFEDLKKRAKAAIPHKEVPDTVCLQCHTPANDNNFVYAEKVLKINHHLTAGTTTSQVAATPPAGQGKP